MTENKKTTIFIISILVVLVVALLVVYLLIPKDKEEGVDPSKDIPKNLADGESYYINKITLYPAISRDSILSIDVVNKDGVKTSIASKAGDTKMYLKGYEGILPFSTTLTSTSFFSIIRFGVTTENDENLPIRNCTEEYMASLHLTEETCNISYTVKFLDEENNEKEITVFIGEPAFSDGARYVAVKGRSSVYTMFDLEPFDDITPEKCVDPIIYQKYSESTVATSIKGLFISLGEKPIVTVLNTTALGAAYGEAVYTLQYPVKTLADSNYVLNIITQLFTNFRGDEVVSIKPNNATLAKYGLDDINHIYGITASHASGDETIFFISELQEDGYYYMRSQLYKEHNIDLIIRIPESTLSFLTDDEDKMVKWAATNTPLSGLYKYLHEDKEANQSGVKQITLRTPNFEETFYLTTEKRVIDGTERIWLKVVPKSGKSNLIFEDNYSVLNNKDDNDASYKINQFRNFYTYLISYPMPIRFCNLTDEEIKASKTEKNFLFEVSVVTNDGEAEKYTYYANEKSPGYVIREESIGTYDGENYNFESVDVLFDVTREHVNRLTGALTKLINGEFIDPRNDLY